MEKHRAFEFSQIAQHKSKRDCWLIIGGKVLDVTKFLEEHPGGEEVLLESAGKDATENFEDVGHSNVAKKMLLKYQIGYLQGDHRIQEDNSNNALPAPYMEPKPNNRMTAFVVKEDPKPKYSVLMEFIVPVMVGGASFLAYRYLTGVSY